MLNRRNWNRNEINRLQKFYPNSHSLAVANYLDRSLESVYHKARRMGIRKSEGASRNEEIVISVTGRKRYVF